MNDLARANPITLSIAAVERDTGLSKDTLRVWERRYGFPTPARDGLGERAYTLEEVEKLRIVKRLMDAGHRPGRIVALPLAQLQELAAQTVDQPLRAAEAALDAGDLRAHLERLRAHDVSGLQSDLARLLSRHGVGRFVTEVVAPLNVAIGDAWVRGQVEIFEEHLYTEIVQALLHQAITAIPDPGAAAAPRVLLATFPGEPHGLGLLMAQAMLALEGCRCVSLGTQTPVWDIALAAAALRADVVALGFSGCMNPNQVVDGLTELRRKLPAERSLWVGGSAPVLHRRAVPGVRAIATLDGIPTAVADWRTGAVAGKSLREAAGP
ncbi:MAG: MerR family transcriptional regulator [Rubrivivax sp.]|nr:MerR family transcriptional regulator [Rubrivivax sp.]